MPSQGATKRFVAFQGFALCFRACREISREHALGYSPTPPSSPAWWQAEKRKYKKSAVGGKKSPATPVQKNDYLIVYRYRHIVGITQTAVPAVVTPSANRNSYRVAKWGGVLTQGRGAAPLNLGL